MVPSEKWRRLWVGGRGASRCAALNKKDSKPICARFRFRWVGWRRRRCWRPAASGFGSARLMPASAAAAPSVRAQCTVRAVSQFKANSASSHSQCQCLDSGSSFWAPFPRRAGQLAARRQHWQIKPSFSPCISRKISPIRGVWCALGKSETAKMCVGVFIFVWIHIARSGKKSERLNRNRVVSWDALRLHQTSWRWWWGNSQSLYYINGLHLWTLECIIWCVEIDSMTSLS